MNVNEIGGENREDLGKNEEKIMLSHKEHHKEYHKEYMQKFRDNGRDNWRKTKRAKYNAIKYAKSMVDNFNRLQEWNIKDINEILKMDKPDLELSKLLGRSVKAIQVKRSKLKSKRRREK